MANKGESSVGALSCWVVAAVFAAGLVHLVVSLRAVQVTGAADYNYASARQSVRRVQTSGLRGRILGRDGEVLAGGGAERNAAPYGKEGLQAGRGLEPGKPAARCGAPQAELSRGRVLV